MKRLATPIPWTKTIGRGEEAGSAETRACTGNPSTLVHLLSSCPTWRLTLLSCTANASRHDRGSRQSLRLALSIFSFLPTSCHNARAGVSLKGMSTADNASEGFRLHTGNVAQTGLHFLSAGKGEPVVLLHGWGGFKEMWWGTTPALSPSHRVIAFDWPGHGSSDPLETGLPVLYALADLALTRCAALSLCLVTLVGHFVGGNVVAWVAVTRPVLVARLAIIDA